jgi:hypothetical protein
LRVDVSSTISSNAVASLQYATQQVSIYVGFVVTVGGLIGNILNIVIFVSLKTFRRTSCGFYLTIASAVSLVDLFSAVLSRVLISGYQIDLTITSPVICKLRLYIVINSAPFWFTCLCFAAIDQVASLTDRWRHFNNIVVARRLVIVALVLWCLHGIPGILYFNIILLPTNRQPICGITNPTFQVYSTRFYFPILLGCLPLVIRVTFGLLAFLRVRSLASRQLSLCSLTKRPAAYSYGMEF